MAEHQAAFLLTISGNVQEQLKVDKAVLSASWEYLQKQTSVFVEAQVQETGESFKAGRALKKHFSRYGIVRSVHYCPGGVGEASPIDWHKIRRVY